MSNNITTTNEERIKKFGDLVDTIADWLHKTETKEIEKSSISDLTYNELHTLKVIGTMDGAKLYEIADKVGVSRPSMSAAIDKLEKKDYVYRDKDKQDRRAVIIRLTDRGFNANQEHEELHHRVAEALLEQLSEQQQEIMVKIFENLFK